MFRAPLILAAVGLLSLWVQAQPVAPRPTAGEQLRLFRGNRSLLEHLIDQSLKIANTSTGMDRVAACSTATRVLGQIVSDTATDPTSDPDRIAELTEHLTELVSQGLLPTLSQVREEVPAGSQEAARLQELQKSTWEHLLGVQTALTGGGPLGRSTAVQDARQKLVAAIQTMAPPK